MNTFATKWFGDISIDKSTGSIDVEYKNKKVSIRFFDFNNAGSDIYWTGGPDDTSPVDNAAAYMSWCVDAINSYPDIDESARKFFVEDFSKEKMIKRCFQNYLDKLDEEQIYKLFRVKTVDEFNIKTIVEKLDYPDLRFELDQGHIITCVSYKISDLCPAYIICLEMDEYFEIIAYGNLD